MIDYSKSIELDPRNARAYNNRGSIYATLKEYDKALANFTRAIELDPQFTGAYSNRGLVYANLKEYDKALTDYSKVIELAPQNVGAYYNMACTYASQEKAIEACEWLEKAIARDDECRQWARDDADFDKIRGDARFTALIGRNE